MLKTNILKDLGEVVLNKLEELEENKDDSFLSYLKYVTGLTLIIFMGVSLFASSLAFMLWLVFKLGVLLYGVHWLLSLAFVTFVSIFLAVAWQASMF